MGAVTGDYDVAVVGLGPVGATLANLLALSGLSVLCLDREPTVYGLPRAVQVDGECLRVFQTLGVAAALSPHISPVPGMRFVDSAGRLILDWSRPMEIGPQGWCASYRFHQPELEACLRARLASWPKVDIRLRHDVFSLDVRADHVVLRWEDLATGRLGEARASYVVGCDGARSTVRRFIGSELADLKSHERWLVVDVILKQPRPDLGDYAIQFCDPVCPATYIRGIGERRRWEIMLEAGEDAAAAQQPSAVWRLLSRWVGPEEAVLERSAVYTFHSVLAETWRRDRLLIAGDAAHQTPPFMGQGMCTGIRDAANLAWKLADVIGGESEPSLLDTYESERSPHARVFINEAVRLGGVIRAISARANEAAAAAEPERFVTPSPKLGPGVHEAGSHGGELSEQPRLDEDALLDDAIGFASAVVARPDLAATLAARDEGLKVVAAASPAVLAWLDRLEASAVVLRPDRYIFGVARTEPALEALIARYAVARRRRVYVS
jgi:3-(3-hydroxy-phenyl)propionate hydroxylase